MDRVEQLLRAYQDRVDRPWPSAVSGPERVWIAVYPTDIERRLRLRIPEFGVVTKDAGKQWRHLDLTNAFAGWLGAHEYRERLTSSP